MCLSVDRAKRCTEWSIAPAQEILAATIAQAELAVHFLIVVWLCRCPTLRIPTQALPCLRAMRLSSTSMTPMLSKSASISGPSSTLALQSSLHAAGILTSCDFQSSKLVKWLVHLITNACSINVVHL